MHGMIYRIWHKIVGEPTPSPSQEGIFRPYYSNGCNPLSIVLITLNPKDPDLTRIIHLNSETQIIKIINNYYSCLIS
jgi:hypothetical protein